MLRLQYDPRRLKPRFPLSDFHLSDINQLAQKLRDSLGDLISLPGTCSYEEGVQKATLNILSLIQSGRLTVVVAIDGVYVSVGKTRCCSDIQILLTKARIKNEMMSDASTTRPINPSFFPLNMPYVVIFHQYQFGGFDNDAEIDIGKSIENSKTHNNLERENQGIDLWISIERPDRQFRTPHVIGDIHIMNLHAVNK